MAEKVIFDGAAKTVTVKAGVNEIDVMRDLYMASVDWIRLEDGHMWLPPFKAGGREPTNVARTQFTPSYIFIINGWTIVCDTGENISFQTNLYPDPDGTTTTDSMFTVSNNTIVSNRQSDSPVVMSEFAKILEYQGVIYINVDAEDSGDEYPYGTAGAPVNNALDAKLVGERYALTQFILNGDLVVPGGTFDDFTITGSAGSSIIADGNATFINGRIISCTISGNLGASSTGMEFIDCNISAELENLDGLFRGCMFSDNIRLKDEGQPVLVNCYSDCPPGIPGIIFDFGDSSFSNNLDLRNFMGKIIIRNLNSVSKTANLGMGSGRVTLEDTCTAGTIGIAGLPYTALVNNSGPGLTVKTDLLLASHDTLAEALATIAYNGMVIIDVQHGAPGTTYPIGTHENPVDNFTDAMTIANSRTIEKLHIHDDIYVNQDITGFVIEGKSGKEAVILQNVDVDGCYFKNVYLAGMAASGAFRGEQVAITDGFVGLNGAFTRCGIVGDFTAIGENPTLFENCFALAYDKTIPIMYMGAIDDLTPYYVNFRGFFGKIIVANMSGPNQKLTMGFNGGGVILDSSNTDGTIAINGLTRDAIIDNSDGTTITYGNTPAGYSDTQAIMAILSQLTITDGEVLAELSATSKQIVRDAMALSTAETPELDSIDNKVDRIDSNTQE